MFSGRPGGGRDFESLTGCTRRDAAEHPDGVFATDCQSDDEDGGDRIGGCTRGSLGALEDCFEAPHFPVIWSEAEPSLCKLTRSLSFAPLPLLKQVFFQASRSSLVPSPVFLVPEMSFFSSSAFKPRLGLYRSSA